MPQATMQQLLMLVLMPMLLLLLDGAVGQDRLSDKEMGDLMGHKPFTLQQAPAHECHYVNLTASQSVQLTCPSLQPKTVCGDKPVLFTRCCPGFRRFTDLDGTAACNQRVLPSRRLADSVRELASEAATVRSFNEKFVATQQVDITMRRGGSWTLLAVADPAFDTVNMTGFQNLNECTTGGHNVTVKSGTGNATSEAKTVEGSAEHQARIYKGKCLARDFTKEPWKLLVNGRWHILPDGINQETRDSALRMPDGGRYPVKLTTYANGVTCIECAPVVEANHEAANGVVHILGKNILTGKQAQNLSQLLKTSHPTFWSSLDSETRRSLSCGMHTVLLPSGNASDMPPEVARKHVLPGLWCTAAILTSGEGRPVPTLAGDSVQLECNKGVKAVKFGETDSVELDDNPHNVDIMAVDGVVHQLKGRLSMHSGRPFESAFQLDSPVPDNGLAMRLLAQCQVHFRPEFGHIVLAPTDAALDKFLTHKSYSAVPEARQLKDSQKFRCQLMRHHVLLVGHGVTDLRLAGQWQRVYRTLDGHKVAGFILRDREDIRASFMGVSVSGVGTPFPGGRVYNIDDVIIPPQSRIWADIIERLYSDQTSTIARFNELSAGDNTMATLFLPMQMQWALSNESVLQDHVATTAFFFSHFSGDPESIELATASGKQLIVSRHLGQFWVRLDGGHRQVRISHCGVRVTNGIICSIILPLTASSDTLEDFESLEELDDLPDSA